ncbi:hypothetical protein TIFTF001_038772 [Ficus carica]|uniref:Uncharacterized protein n=1 Tax=Ficus carica TaxID=3494 RepID=A0AA88JDE0_FICCA|nr:hypothetical protein TIFTF001_038772 [Ficus carica]
MTKRYSHCCGSARVTPAQTVAQARAQPGCQPQLVPPRAPAQILAPDHSKPAPISGRILSQARVTSGLESSLPDPQPQLVSHE